MKRILSLATVLVLVFCSTSFAYYLEYNVGDNIIWNGFNLDYHSEEDTYSLTDTGNSNGDDYWSAVVQPSYGETYDAFATIEVTYIPEVRLISGYKGFSSFDYYLRGEFPEIPIIETFTFPVGETFYEGFPNAYVPVPYLVDYPEPIIGVSYSSAYVELSVSWDAIVRLTGVHLNATPVPEPATITLISMGFLGIAVKCRRKL